MGEIIEYWQGDVSAVRPGRAVLIGFPQDEGVRRNGGRPGATEAPRAIRHRLHRLTPWDALADVDLRDQPPLDVGDVRITGTLEETQQALGNVVAAVLAAGAVPVVLGGGHETAYGHYLGYVANRQAVGILNIDAHLDVRPVPGGQGHSGSPFRQALEHPHHPLPGPNYVCLGAQPGSVSRDHWRYVRDRGGAVRWAEAIEKESEAFSQELERLARSAGSVYVTLDADAVRAADVPGVSAPNSGGLSGAVVLRYARLAGRSPQVSSFDLVEICPPLDRDEQSVRWAAHAIWHFLIGVAQR